MKKFIKVVLVLILIFSFSNVAEAAKPITILLNGEALKPDVEPFIESDRVFVPVRFIAEGLDCVVNWDGADRMVTIHKLRDKADPRSIYDFFGMRIGEKRIIEVDDSFASVLSSQPGNHVDEMTFRNFTVTKDMDVAPKIVGDRTFVPIRFVAEQFGLTVDWENENRAVVIRD